MAQTQRHEHEHKHHHRHHHEHQSSALSLDASTEPPTPKTPQPAPVHLSLESALKMLTLPGKTQTVDVASHRVVLSVPFVEVRCPNLLQAHLKFVPVSLVSLDSFMTFLYSDSLPESMAPMEWIGLARLLDTSGFHEESRSALNNVLKWGQALNSPAEIEEVIKLYVHSLDLPSPGGIEVCLALLRKHKALVPTEKLPQLLKEYPDQTQQLLDLLQKESHLSPTASYQANTSTHSIVETLRILYEKRDQGDFEIQISGTEIPVKCHAFVIQARWPYARIMANVNFEDVVKHRMKVPKPGEDGGIHKEAIEALLELLYLGAVRPDTLRALSPASALTITSNVELYFHSMDDLTLFKPLIDAATDVLARSVTGQNCLELYKVATGIGANQVADHAKAVFVQHFVSIWEDSKQQDVVFSLEPSARERLLWASLAHFAKIQHHGMNSHQSSTTVDTRRARYEATHDK